MSSQYQIPLRLQVSFVWSALALRPRSMARDARTALAAVHPQPKIVGSENIPASSACLVACNHYTRPGLASWWFVMAISAAVASHRAAGADPEIHWVTTAAWTFPNSAWRRGLLTPLTRWAFGRMAQVYGYVPMPPMPPDPNEVEARAVAVRKTLRLARWAAQNGGMIGLAPEGRDVPEGLGQPPEGAGDFIALLTGLGLPILPTGVAEYKEHLRLGFGPIFMPHLPAARAERDQAVTDQVMAAIAQMVAIAQQLSRTS